MYLSKYRRTWYLSCLCELYDKKKLLFVNSMRKHMMSRVPAVWQLADAVGSSNSLEPAGIEFAFSVLVWVSKNIQG